MAIHIHILIHHRYVYDYRFHDKQHFITGIYRVTAIKIKTELKT